MDHLPVSPPVLLHQGCSPGQGRGRKVPDTLGPNPYKLTSCPVLSGRQGFMTSTTSTPRKCFPVVLLRFVLLLVCLAALAQGCYLAAVHILHLGEPYNRILLLGHGVDLLGYQILWPRVHQFSFFTDKTWPIYRYPAPVFLIYAFFFSLPHVYKAFNLVVFAMFAAAGTLLIRAIAARGIVLWKAAAFVCTCALLSYPIYFEFRQSNTEPFILLLLGLAVWSMLRGHDNTAAALLGVAGSMKIYPFIFLGLYLVRRRVGPLVVSALTAVVLTLVSLRYLTPSILFSWHGIGDGLANYNVEFEHFIPLTIGYDHSPFTLVKFAARLVPFLQQHIRTLLHVYLAVAALTGITLFFTTIRKLPFTNQVFSLILAETFLPPSTYDYTLIHLFIPAAMLILFAIDQADRVVPGLNTMFLCLALLLGFETELIFHHQRLGGCFKALVFLVLFGLVLRFPLHGTWPEDPLRRARST